MSSTKETKRPTLRELMFRSTIYSRHEARRAQTLLRKGDPRPALLRVFAPPPPPLSSAPRSVASQEPLAVGNDSLFPVVASSWTAEDGSVFTLHSTSQQEPSASPPRASVTSSVLASIVGASFSEAVYGARCLSVASPFSFSRTAAVPGQTRVVWHPEHATLMMQQSWHSAPTSPLGLFRGLSWTQLMSRAAPVAVLFGTKSAVEHGLASDAPTAPPPPAAVSILSSAVAGGVWGVCGSLVPSRKPSIGFSSVGREMAGATLYFTVYDGAKHACTRQLGLRPVDLNPLATMGAGAVAGVVYDSVRYVYSSHQYAVVATTATTPLASLQTRSMAATVLRAAPSHALLFLGYEAALRLSHFHQN